MGGCRQVVTQIGGREWEMPWILINRRPEAQTRLLSCSLPYLAIGGVARSARENSDETDPAPKMKTLKQVVL